MITAISFYNLLKKCFSLFTALLLLLTGMVNSLFTGDIYPYESSTDTVALETLTRTQGVTTDGEGWIFSGKNALEKISIETNEIIALNPNAIPKELSEKFGSKHIGGISYHNGIVYAAIEDTKQWKYPIVALYDSQTLEYTGTYFILPTEQHTRGIPWVTVDAEHGVAYAGDSRNDEEIFVYDLETFEYLRTVTLSQEIEDMQGGEYGNGKLYIGSNDITRAVYSVDVNTGEVTKLFDRIMYEYKYIDNFGGEGEGLTLLKCEDGTYIHTLQLGALFIDASLRHYKLPE